MSGPHSEGVVEVHLGDQPEPDGHGQAEEKDTVQDRKGSAPSQQQRKDEVRRHAGDEEDGGARTLVAAMVSQ